MSLSRRLSGFTIVELLIVIVVIAILAAITLVAYNGITSRAVESGMKSDLQTAATTIGIDNVNNGSYPSSSAAANNGQGLKSSSGNTLSYIRTTTGYCAVVSNPRIASLFSITETGAMTSTSCLPVITNGSPIQNVANVNCPSTRTRVVDARDSHTYWVQKLADGKCWMLTNLAYAGGGTNTYEDTKALVDGTADASAGIGYTTARYHVVPSTTNYTTEPTNPSTSTNGIGQYGYFYSRCGAAGGQTTAACGNSGSEDASISVCPAGWRLPVMPNPTGPNDIGVDLGALNAAINGGLTNTDTGLRTAWLGQYGGAWNGSFGGAGTRGQYWTTPVVKASAFYYGSSAVGVIGTGIDNRFAVRCLV